MEHDMDALRYQMQQRINEDLFNDGAQKKVYHLNRRGQWGHKPITIYFARLWAALCGHAYWRDIED